MCGYMVNVWLTFFFLVCIDSDGCVEEDKSGVSKKMALSSGARGGHSQMSDKSPPPLRQDERKGVKPMKDKGISALA